MENLPSNSSFMVGSRNTSVNFSTPRKNTTLKLMMERKTQIHVKFYLPPNLSAQAHSNLLTTASQIEFDCIPTDSWELLTATEINNSQNVK